MQTGYNYFRDYDPASGRYVESDPIGLNGGINTYGYASGAPTSRLDPLGLTDVYRGPGGYYGDVPGPGGCESAVFAGGALVGWVPCPEPKYYNDYSINYSQGAGANPSCPPTEGDYSSLAWELLKPDWTMFIPYGKLATLLPLLKRIHSIETITKGSNRFDYESIKRMTTRDIVDSLRPGAKNPLRVAPDGRIMDGNTRALILEERGYDINSLPRTPHP